MVKTFDRSPAVQGIGLDIALLILSCCVFSSPQSARRLRLSHIESADFALDPFGMHFFT
jgi:hypothetical protein